MLYALYQLQRHALRPTAALARAQARLLRASSIPGAEPLAAGWELLHRLTKEYPRPSFDLAPIETRGGEVALSMELADRTPFCRLWRFARRTDDAALARTLEADPKVLLAAPLSGHFASLLRDTVRSMAQDHDVYVTDWADAREVPRSEGTFGLDDYVAHLVRFARHVDGAGRAAGSSAHGGRLDVHVVAVCQPAVPALAMTSLLASAGEPTPRSLVLMGGPIDARRSPTAVNRFATSRPLSWFERHLIHRVPPGHPGAGRRVYPGFLQLGAFVSMNPQRHAEAHRDYWLARALGDHARAEAHERFYDEYNAVLDMDARYYLETVGRIFQEHALARGTWDVVLERGGAARRIRPEDVRDTAVLTVEGAEDDVTGAGQTHAAHDLLRGLPDARRAQHTAPGCGHYGIFSGRRWRESIHPRVRDFVRAHAG